MHYPITTPVVPTEIKLTSPLCMNKPRAWKSENLTPIQSTGVKTYTGRAFGNEKTNENMI